MGHTICCKSGDDSGDEDSETVIKNESGTV